MSTVETEPSPVPPLDLPGFYELFGLSIRAMLDWEGLRTAGANISTTIITGTERLGELHTVWFVDRDGFPGDWREPGHRPQRVAEASRSRGAGGEQRRQPIEWFAEQFALLQGPLVLTVPVYRAAEQLLLLDATHRSAAAHLSVIDVQVVAHCIEGPIDERLLPDLRWFASA